MSRLGPLVVFQYCAWLMHAFNLNMHISRMGRVEWGLHVVDSLTTWTPAVSAVETTVLGSTGSICGG